MRFPSLAVGSVAFALVVSAAAQKDAKKTPEKIVDALFQADPYSAKGCTEIDMLVSELEKVELKSTADALKWSDKMLKLWAKGAKLGTKNGQHFLWEKPTEKGMYLVGGESKSPKALAICMHGGGKGSGDAWSAQGGYNPALKDLDWLAIYPEVLEKTEHGWTDSGSEEFVLQLVDAALRTWKIDRDKVFFCGHSMGGYGSWTLGAHHADRVAGLAPSAGAPSPIFDAAGHATDIGPGVIPNLRNVPIAIYQSDDDPNVPPAANRCAAQKLKEAQAKWGGFPYEYWEVPGRQHDLPPGGPKALLDKIKDKKRDARPSKVVWQPTVAWKRQFYWLWWSKPSPNALVVAEIDKAKNEIRVTCSVEPRGLEVLVDEKLVDWKQPLLVYCNDKEVFRGTPKLDLGTVAKTARGGDEALVFTARVPLAP